MLKSKIILSVRYTVNILEHLIIQVLLPNKLRGFIFQTLTRQK